MTKGIIIDSTLAQYTAEDFSWLQNFFLNAGIFADSAGSLGLAVSQRGAGANMSVDVAIGNALMSFTKNATTWKIIGLSNAITNVPIANNSSGSNRVDAIIMRASVVNNPNALKNNIITIEVVLGSGVSALSDGAIQSAIGADSFIRLANVTVTNGAVSIVTGNIADTRVQVKTNEAITLAPKNLKFTVQATDPASPVEGQVWYNSTTHTINFYNNSTVVALGGSSAFLQDSDTTKDGWDQQQTTQNASRPVGEVDATTRNNQLAQSVQFAKTTVAGITLNKQADSGSFTGTVTVALYADSAGSPTGSALATVTIPNATWLAIPVGNFEAVFGTPYTAPVATTFWFVISCSTADNTNHPNLGTASGGGYASGSAKFKNTTDGWTAIATIDLFFQTLTGIATKVLRADANNFVPAFTPYAADAGSTDDYAIQVAGVLSYVAGHQYSFKANTLNTQDCTLNVNGLGKKSIVKNGTMPLETGDIIAGQIVVVEYDGTNFQLLSKPTNMEQNVYADQTFQTQNTGTWTGYTATIKAGTFKVGSVWRGMVMGRVGNGSGSTGYLKVFWGGTLIADGTFSTSNTASLIALEYEIHMITATTANIFYKNHTSPTYNAGSVSQGATIPTVASDQTLLVQMNVSNGDVQYYSSQLSRIK